MPSRVRRFGSILGLACLLGAPLAVHLALITHRFTGLAGVMIAAQAAGIVFVVLSFSAASRRGWVRLPACGAMFALTVAIWLRSGDGLMLAAAVPHTLSYLGVLAVFAGSLAPGRVPVITIVAQRARGPLSPVLLRYTRSVTVIWCVFFAVQVLASLLLWAQAPLSWWSAFVNLGTVPMVLLMFAAELTWRHFHHGIHRPQDGGSRLVQALAQLRLPIRQIRP